MIKYIGKPGDTVRFNTGSEIITLTGPVPLMRLFHAPTLTTLEFIDRRDIGRLELVGIRVWKHWRDACKDMAMRGTPVIVLCDNYGPTRLEGRTLTMSAIDATINVGCYGVTLYPDWTDQQHHNWQTKLFADAGSSHSEALRTAWCAITARSAPGNPSMSACMADTVRHYPADVAGYRNQLKQEQKRE